MKLSYTIILGLALNSLVQTVQSQSNHDLSLDAVSIGSKNVRLVYQYSLNENLALNLEFTVLSGLIAHGVKIGGGLRYYFDNIKKGPFTSLFLKTGFSEFEANDFAYQNSDNGNADESHFDKLNLSFETLNLGINGGYRWIFWDKMIVTLRAGYGVLLKNEFNWEYEPIDSIERNDIDTMEKIITFFNGADGEVSIGLVF